MLTWKSSKGSIFLPANTDKGSVECIKRLLRDSYGSVFEAPLQFMGVELCLHGLFLLIIISFTSARLCARQWAWAPFTDLALMLLSDHLLIELQFKRYICARHA